MQKYLQNIKQRFLNLRSYKNFRIILFLLLVFLTGLLVFQVMQVQDSRNRANEPLTSPQVSKYPIDWVGDKTYIMADDFYVIANGKKFVPNSTMKVVSSSVRFDNPTTGAGHMDVEWTSDGVVMGIYFNLILTNGQWGVESFRTGNGSGGSRIYYNGFTGGPLGIVLEKAVFDQNSSPSNPVGVSGSVYFENFKMLAFIVGTTSPTPTVTFTPTPLPTRPATPSPTPVKVSLIATDDTYSSSAAPYTVYGTKTLLVTNLQPLEYAYLKFDLSSLAGKTVISAQLKLKSGSDSSTNTQFVKGVADTAWKESTLTYRNKPAISTIVQASFVADKTNTWYTIPVTNYVGNYVGTKLSLAIDVRSRDRLSIFSKESSYKPVLEVVYR